MFDFRKLHVRITCIWRQRQPLEIGLCQISESGYNPPPSPTAYPADTPPTYNQSSVQKGAFLQFQHINKASENAGPPPTFSFGEGSSLFTNTPSVTNMIQHKSVEHSKTDKRDNYLSIWIKL